MKIGVATIAYSQPDSLLKLIDSLEGIDEFHVFIHSQMQQWITMFSGSIDRHGLKMVPYGYGFNRGVAASWNDSILNMTESGCDVIILVNEDVWFTPGDIEKLAQGALNHRDCYVIMCSGYNYSISQWVPAHGFSCIAINPVFLEVLGMFDENFFPAYNEDVDIAKRSVLAGITSHTVGDTNVQHLGSASIRTNPLLRQQNFVTHDRNDRYWLEKWGCDKDPHSVGFPFPFNDRRLHPYYIAPEMRHAPYPGHNRKDQNLVKI